MRLDEITIRSYRSVWGRALSLRLAPSVTALVGPNLAGKSNVARALAAALDPAIAFDLGRERPHTLADAVPEVVCHFSGHAHGRPQQVDLTVSWPGGQRVERIRPGGEAALPLGPGRLVLGWGTDAPSDILRRALPVLGGEDPDALAADLLPTLCRVLPEVASVAITLDPPTVRVYDDLGYEVAAPTVRATFAAAVAAHHVRRGEDLAAIVVEEPEAFLHPKAQEALRDELLEVGVAADAPVLITTESPFVIPRAPESRIVAIARDAKGATTVVGAEPGDAPHATLLGGLFRDPGLAAVLDRTLSIPDDAAAVLIVEGGTDEAYLRLAARVLGRDKVLERLQVHQGGGALPAALHAIVLRAETHTPLFVLLDNDDPGRRAKETLVGRFSFDNRRQVTTYAEVIPDHPAGAEAEDVFDWRLVEQFVAERGDRSIRGKRILRHDEWHFDLTSGAKSSFVGWLDEHARAEHLARWALLLDLIEERLLPP